MAPKPKNPRKRGLLRTILGKPYNSKIFPNRPTPSGGEVVKKFSPTPHSRNVNRVVPDLQGKTAPIDDGSYSVASGGKSVV